MTRRERHHWPRGGHLPHDDREQRGQRQQRREGERHLEDDAVGEVVDVGDGLSAHPIRGHEHLPAKLLDLFQRQVPLTVDVGERRPGLCVDHRHHRLTFAREVLPGHSPSSCRTRRSSRRAPCGRRPSRKWWHDRASSGEVSASTRPISLVTDSSAEIASRPSSRAASSSASSSLCQRAAFGRYPE